MNKQKSKEEKKKAIRTEYLKKRNQMDAEQRKAASKKIREWVYANKRFKLAQTVFVYASYKSEVETKELIQYALRQGKQVAVPKVTGEEMEFYEIKSWEELFPGYQGILEPQTEGKTPVVPRDGDICILPGAVFDRRGNRIGYGGGFYDRYLSRIKETYGKRPYLMALAFWKQIHPWILPVEKHDIKMDCILTEKSVIMLREKSGGMSLWVFDVIEFIIELVLEVLDGIF